MPDHCSFLHHTILRSRHYLFYQWHSPVQSSHGLLILKILKDSVCKSDFVTIFETIWYFFWRADHFCRDSGPRGAGNILNVMETEVLKEEILMVCTIKRAVPFPVNATFATRIGSPGEDCSPKTPASSGPWASMNVWYSVCEISVMALSCSGSLFSVRRS